MNSDYYTTNIIEKFNSPLHTEEIDYKVPLHVRNPPQVGKLSLNHPETIEYLVRMLKPECYLELGIQFGEVLRRVLPLIPIVVGVDIVITEEVKDLSSKYSSLKLMNCSTDDFFTSVTELGYKYDMVFIDADHSHISSLRDFERVFPFVHNDGFILLHDTYPSTKEWTSSNLCGDSWKTAEYIRKNYIDRCEILTLPVNPGLTLVRKCDKQVAWKE